MKRIAALAAAAALILCAFAGCGEAEPVNAEEPQQEEIVETRTLSAVIYDRGGDEEYWKAVIAAFEEDNPGVTVDAYIGDDAAYIARDNILSGASPDFVVLPSEEETGVTKALILDKALLAIDDMERTASTLLLSGAMDNVVSRPYDDGSAYLAPLFFDVQGLICNSTLLDEHGWSVPETWEDFLALGKEAKAEKVSLISYAGAESDTLMPLFASAVAGADGTSALDSLFRYGSDWSADSVKAIFENVSALEEYVTTGSASLDSTSLITEFEKGRTLFIPGNADTLAALRGEELEADEEGAESEESSESSSGTADGGEQYDYTMTAYPKLAADDDTVTVISFTEMYIPYEAQNQDLAKKLLIFQYSDTAAKLAAEKAGEVTPVLKAVQIAKDAGITGARLDSYTILDEIVAAPLFMNVVGANETLSDEFFTAFSGILRGDTEVEASVEKMNDLYEEMQ